MKIFISHIEEEVAVATELKSWLENSFNPPIEVFVSSNPENAMAGDWKPHIGKEIGESNILIALMSPFSVNREWIIFESGAAWVQEKIIIPICFNGLEDKHLPAPLKSLNSLFIEDSKFYSRLSTIIMKAAIKLERTKSNINDEEAYLKIANAANEVKSKNINALDILRTMSIQIDGSLSSSISDRLKNYFNSPILRNHVCKIDIHDYSEHWYLVESHIEYKMSVNHYSSSDLTIPIRYRQRYQFNDSKKPKDTDEWIKRFTVCADEQEFDYKSMKPNERAQKFIVKVESTILELPVRREVHDYILQFNTDYKVTNTKEIDVAFKTSFLTSKDAPFEVIRVYFPSQGLSVSLNYKKYGCLFSSAWFLILDPTEHVRNKTTKNIGESGIITSTREWILPGDGVILTFNQPKELHKDIQLNFSSNSSADTFVRIV